MKDTIRQTNLNATAKVLSASSLAKCRNCAPVTSWRRRTATTANSGTDSTRSTVYPCSCWPGWKDRAASSGEEEEEAAAAGEAVSEEDEEEMFLTLSE